jgi:hypothetical protein
MSRRTAHFITTPSENLKSYDVTFPENRLKLLLAGEKIHLSEPWDVGIRVAGVARPHSAPVSTLTLGVNSDHVPTPTV